MAIATPHWQAHFNFNAKGESSVVEQGSSEDLLARAYNVLACPKGFREDKPEFGIPEVLFKTVPLNTAGVQEAVAQWAEVDLSVLESEGANPALRNLLAEVTG